MKKLFLCLLLLMAGRVSNAGQIEYVTNTSDSGSGSLRNAITNVSPNGYIYVIIGPLASHTINLQSPLIVSKNMTINGKDKGGSDSCLIIDAGGRCGVISIASSSPEMVTLQNITITGGYCGTGGGLYINNNATVNVTDCTISNNDATTGAGGGVYCEGTLNLNRCTIFDNSSYWTGSGICVYGQASQLSMINSTIVYNYSQSASGAIYINHSNKESFMNACTICYNLSLYKQANGAGLSNSGSLYCYNSIIAGNYNTQAGPADVYNDGNILGEGYNVTGITDGYTWSANGNWISMGSITDEFAKVGSMDTGYLYPDSTLKNNGGPTQTLALTNANTIAKSIDSYTEYQKIIINGQFGHSVAISSDCNTAVIGIDGGAYVFVRNNGIWNLQTELKSSDESSGDGFGISAAISSDGNTIIVGAENKNSSTGAAYVFTRNSNTWAQQQKLTASDGAELDCFGHSVALSADGSTAIIGAVGEDDSAGAAYVFTRNDNAWLQQQKLVASDGFKLDGFGYALAISSDGNTAIIGAFHQNKGLGAAYVFTRSGSVWSQQQKLTAPQSNSFGCSIAISADGNVAIVGAVYSNAAYIFVRNGNSWTQQQELTANDADQYYFGYSVAVSANDGIAAIGAISKNDDTGAVYIFARCGNGSWTLQKKLTGMDESGDKFFGNDVNLSAAGDAIIIGTTESAGAYIFFDANNCPDVDQRNFLRDTSPRCIGAYEYGAVAP